MDRLSVLDLAFLDLDTGTAPLHVGWTMQMEGSPPSLFELRQHIESRLPLVPRFRRRVARPVLGAPRWVDDEQFAISRHVVDRTLPAGTALHELAGELLSTPLDLDHPLWRMHLVDGLPDGRFAVVGQAHHALVDGISAMDVALLLFDVAGQAPMVGHADELPPPLPSERLLRAVRSGVRAIKGARELAGAVGQLTATRTPTALDGSRTSRRAIAFATTGLDEVRRTGQAHGATINDVLLSAVASALGAALRRRGEDLERLPTLVPVSVRPERRGLTLGNSLSFVSVELPVGEDDPVRALHAVQEQMDAAKAGGAGRALESLVGASELLPARLRRVCVRAAARRATYSAAVSNLPGPTADLVLLGRLVTAMHPAVPLYQGRAISIGALSYRGELQCGVCADAEVVPDAVEIAQDLETAFERQRAASLNTGPAREVT